LDCRRTVGPGSVRPRYLKRERAFPDNYAAK
jgi:hypothetical protein